MRDFLGVGITNGTEARGEIVKMFERRNILVHKNGMVDTKYRLKTQYQGEDEQLSVDREYLSKAPRTIGVSTDRISSHLIQKYGSNQMKVKP